MKTKEVITIDESKQYNFSFKKNDGKGHSVAHSIYGLLIERGMFTEGHPFNNFLQTETNKVRIGIVPIYKVKIDNILLIIPLNQLEDDSEKCSLSHSFTKNPSYILTKEQGLKITACYFLSWIVYLYEQMALCTRFVDENGGLDYVAKLQTKFKYEIYNEETIGDLAFDLLD
jgi:hypothetical protein